MNIFNSENKDNFHMWLSHIHSSSSIFISSNKREEISWGKGGRVSNVFQ